MNTQNQIGHECHRPAIDQQQGFTLIEMMITVVLIALLSAFALPAYQSYVQRANRAVAKSALITAAGLQESMLVERKCYATAVTSLGGMKEYLSRDGSTSATKTNISIYQLSINNTKSGAKCPVGSSDAANNTYTLIATPVESQLKDKACATLSLSYTGVKSASGTSPTTCWTR